MNNPASSLSSIYWVIAVIAAYAIACWWIVSVRHAWRTNSKWLAPFLLAVAFFTPLQVLRSQPFSLGTLFAACLGAVVPLAVSHLIAKPRDRFDRKARREDARQTALHLILITGSIIFMVPFLWLLTTSLKDDEDIFTNEVRVLPRRTITMRFDGKDLDLVRVDQGKEFKGQKPGVWAKARDLEDSVIVRPVLTTGELGPEMSVTPERVKNIKKPGAVWENYPDALEYLPEETRRGVVYLNNTLIVTLLSIIGTLLTAAMVAYAFARLRWPGRDGLFIVLLATMMLPGAVTMIPQFLIWQNLGFVDTLVPLWAGAFLGGGAFNIFLLRQFFKTIPTELEEAAKIDGCGYWRIFWTVMLPLVRPALATVAIMTFMGAWNNFMGPLIYISSPTKMTLAYALQLYQTVHGGQFSYLMAASTLVMIPVLVVFFFCQRYFIQGVTLTGIKG